MTKTRNFGRWHRTLSPPFVIVNSRRPRPAGAEDPEGGWQHWLDEVSTSAAGYRKDYEVCDGRTASSSKEAVDLFCAGGAYLLGRNLTSGQATPRNPALAFKNTLRPRSRATFLPRMRLP